MHFVMISLHFCCLLLVVCSFKRLFVDRRGQLHNCKDDLSDGEDDCSVMQTEFMSQRTGQTRNSLTSKQTKNSQAVQSNASRNFASKVINRIELSNHDMEQLLIQKRQEYLSHQ